MIGNLDIKARLHQVFTIGVADPVDTILLIGSCRSVAYLNYLDRAIRECGAQLRVHFIDPHLYHWDGGVPEKWVDFEAAINALETNPRILEVLRNTTIYIHEFYDSYGMFNSSKDAPKNIYQFGMTPRLDICLPNFHNVTILGHTKEVGEAALEKFYSICRLTSFPEMEFYFRDNWQTKRFFWQANHVSKHFTLFLLRQLNDRFLHLNLDDAFWRNVEQEDVYANVPEAVSREDVENYGLKWR